MADDTTPQPKPGSTADLSRRVERLEDGFSELTKAVGSVDHRLDLVTLNQQHSQELMQTKFTALEVLAVQTSTEVKAITTLITKAMQGDPAVVPESQKQLMAEYRAFQQEVRTDIKAVKAYADDIDKRKHKLREEFDDYVLVERTKHEAQSSLISRAFGSSALGAIGGVLGVVLAIAALLGLGN